MSNKTSCLIFINFNWILNNTKLILRIELYFNKSYQNMSETIQSKLRVTCKYSENLVIEVKKLEV